MHLISHVLATSAAMALAAAANRIVTPPQIQFIGVGHNAATYHLPALYNYPDTPARTNWEEMHMSLTNYKTQPGTKTNTFRVPFNFNQLLDKNSTHLVNEGELNSLASVVDKIVKSPGPSPFVVLVPEVTNASLWLKDPDEVYKFWKTLAKKFQPNNHIIFDLGLPATKDKGLAADLSQEAIRAIRRAGARKQYIFLPTAMSNLTDPLRTIIRDPSLRTLFEIDINLVCPHPPHKKQKGPDLIPFTKWVEKTNNRIVVRRLETNKQNGCPAQVEAVLKQMEKDPQLWAGWLWKRNKKEAL